MYGIVSQIGASAIPDNLKEVYLNDYEHFKNLQWVGMTLVGEQVGNKFERGVSQAPTTGDAVHIVTLNDLNVVYGGYDNRNSITVGNISISESLAAKLDLDKLISRHLAVVGSTGSGKSNAIGILLDSIVQKEFKSARILVIDPHGEYNSVLKKDSVVYKIRKSESTIAEKLLIPFWALPFDELISIFSGNLNDQNKDYIRQKITDEKKKAAKVLDLGIEEAIITADSPIPFSIKKLWFELDDFERQTFNERANPETKTELKVQGDIDALISNQYEPASAGGGRPFLNNQAKGILGFLDSMLMKLKDSRYDFLFHPDEYAPDSVGRTEKTLSDLLMSWLGNSKPITILDLSDLPNEIMVSISGTLLKIIYDALFWGQSLHIGGKEQPLLVILEDAHSYLQAGKSSISSRIVRTYPKNSYINSGNIFF